MPTDFTQDNNGYFWCWNPRIDLTAQTKCQQFPWSSAACFCHPCWSRGLHISSCSYGEETTEFLWAPKITLLQGTPECVDRKYLWGIPRSYSNERPRVSTTPMKDQEWVHIGCCSISPEAFQTWLRQDRIPLEESLSFTFLEFHNLNGRSGCPSIRLYLFNKCPNH